MQSLPMPPVPRQSTRLKIGVAFAALALVLFAGVGVLAGIEARRQTAADSAAALRQLATQLADALNTGLEERFREIRNLAVLETVIGGEIGPSEWRALLERTQQSLPSYTWIGLADPDGTVRAATAGLLEGRDVSGRPWFAQGRSAPFAGDVHEAQLLASQLPSRPNGEPLRLLDFAAPVMHDGRLAGVLGAHLDFAWVEDVRRQVQNTREPAGAVELLLVDRGGLPMTGASAAATVPAIDMAALRQGKAVILTRGDGRAYLTAAVDVPGSPGRPGFGWTVLARQPVDVALAAAVRLERRIWMLGLVGALSFGVAAWWLAGRLTAPLRRVVDQAHQFAVSAQSAQPPPVRRPPDEYAQIEESLGALVAALQRRDGQVSELTAANSGLDSFSRNVSHDLKGPIGSIGMTIQLVLEKQAGRLDAETRRLLSLVGTECDRLRRLIDDLLKLAMIEQQPLQLTDVPMAVLVSAVLDDLAGAVPAADRPAVEVGPLPAVRGDLGLLRQVWQNLLANALKFSARAAAPKVQVWAELRDREWVFCVADNGAGFDMKHADRLFGVFQRLHRSSEYPGSGVGLSIVRRIVVAHGGRVWAEGEPGAGARFFFALPVAQ